VTLAERAQQLGPGQRGKAAQLYERALLVSIDAPDEDTQADADEAMDVLEARYPGIRDVAKDGAEAWTAGGRSPRQQAAASRAKGKAAQARAAKPPKPSSGTGAQRRVATSSPIAATRRPSTRRPSRNTRAAAVGFLIGRGSRGYARETGVPQAGWTVAQITLYTFGSIVLLSVAYLVLTSSERGKAGPVELLGLGFTNFTRRIIEPVDPLAPIGQAKAARPGATRRAGRDVKAGTAAVGTGVAAATHARRRRARPGQTIRTTP
jgi:hypothetical protein